MTTTTDEIVFRNESTSIVKVVTDSTDDVTKLYNLSGATSVWVTGDGAGAFTAWLPSVDATTDPASLTASFDDASQEITSVILGSSISGDTHPGDTNEPMVIPKNYMPAYVWFKFAVAGTYCIHINFG